MDPKDMTPDQIRALIEALQTMLDQAQAAPPAPLPPGHPIGALPNIDPFLPAGAPYTDYMEVTHHVLSKVDTVFANGTLAPAPSPIEGLPSYAYRVSDQANGGNNLTPAQQVGLRNAIGNASGIGVPIQSVDVNGDAYVVTGPVKADGSDWPNAVDWFYNHDIYLATWAPKQLARELADRKRQQDAWDKFYGQGGGQ